jgi:L-rhamnose 1-dehydrogenase
VAALKKDVADLLTSTKQDTSGDRFIIVPGDISKPETGTEFIQRTVQTFGRLDVFVSNAGVCRFEEFLEYVYIHLP